MSIPTGGTSFETARWVWKHLVPSSGQSESIQGELLRAIEKLRWEAQSNGNINWDDGFEHFLSFLGHHLGLSESVPAEMRTTVREELARLADFEHPYVDDDLYDRLTDAFAAFVRTHPEEVPNPYNADLHR